jgi:hypothetical protein
MSVGTQVRVPRLGVFAAPVYRPTGSSPSPSHATAGSTALVTRSGRLLPVARYGRPRPHLQSAAVAPPPGRATRPDCKGSTRSVLETQSTPGGRRLTPGLATSPTARGSTRSVRGSRSTPRVGRRRTPRPSDEARLEGVEPGRRRWSCRSGVCHQPAGPDLRLPTDLVGCPPVFSWGNPQPQWVTPLGWS